MSEKDRHFRTMSNPVKCVPNLNFLPALVSRMAPSSPSHRVNDFIFRTSTAVRRALRHSIVRSNPDVYPPYAIALCALAHFSQHNLNDVHSHFIALDAKDECNRSLSSSLPLSRLQAICQHFWVQVFPSLNLSVPTSKTQKPGPKNASPRAPSSTPRSLFHDTHILLIPSPLLPDSTADTLRARAAERGAEARLMSPGAAGLSEARAFADSIKKGNALVDSVDRENGRRVIVIADAALTKRRTDDVAHLDRVLPPRWLTDSLRAERFKPPSLYDVTTKKNTPATAPPVVRKRNMDYSDSFSLTEFRAERNIEPKTANPIKNITGKKRRREEDSSSYEKYNEHNNLDTLKGKSETFTIATRLFATPTKKDTLPENDDKVDKGYSKEAIRSEISTVRKTLVPYQPPVEQIGTKREDRGSRWACEIRAGVAGTDFPANDRICELLAIVQAAHEARKDTFRSLGYQRAIARIKTLDYEILCMDDVRRLEGEANIGSRMALKIEEIVTTGRFQQAESVLNNRQYGAVQRLCGVWGIGPVRAMQLVQNGIDDIEGLRRAVCEKKVVLDRCQMIGMHRYEDLIERMPRSMVAELEMYVKRIAKSVDTQIGITIAGSYIRGKESCGDVDILVHGERRRVGTALPKIRANMKRDGVLTDDLVEGGGKYFGVFRLPGRRHGRIDLFAVPTEEFPYALLTYTGSAVFNRSMRAKARCLGYSLSHKGMQRVIQTKNGKSRMEASIMVENEREIFDMLDIPYVPPSARSIS